MTEQKVCLASDNCAPIHPSVIQSIIDANNGFAAGYGSDRWTEEAQKLIQEAFQADCKIFMVPAGTGANIFGLKLCCRPYQSIICTDIAHIQYQECGAVESIIGCKLLSVPHQEGKVTPSNLLKKLRSERAFGKHSTSPRVLSITQPTEVGTVYNLEELKALSNLCQEENLLFHIDGSRLYNAAVSLNVSLNKMIHGINVDIIALGGTKNGLMGAESLIIFNPALYEGSDHIHKQTLQLLSKMRYLSAQYIPFFKNNLWITLAANANQRALEIASIIKTIPQLSLSYPVETNQIFFTAPASWIPAIQEKLSCYLWISEKNELRFITSWNTSENDVNAVKSVFFELSNNSI